MDSSCKGEDYKKKSASDGLDFAFGNVYSLSANMETEWLIVFGRHCRLLLIAFIKIEMWSSLICLDF
jgi:hypothetical protein